MRGELEFLLKELGKNVDAAGKYASKNFSTVLATVFLGTFFGMLLFGERTGIMAGVIVYSFRLYEDGVGDILASAAAILVIACIARRFDSTVQLMDFALAAAVMVVLAFTYKALGRYAREEWADV